MDIKSKVYKTSLKIWTILNNKFWQKLKYSNTLQNLLNAVFFCHRLSDDNVLFFVKHKSFDLLSDKMCQRNTSTLMCLMEEHSWAKRAVLSLQRHGVAVPWGIFSNMDQPHLCRLVYFNLVLYSRACKNMQKVVVQY